MEITPQELKTKLDHGDKITVIDVRQPNEHAICRLKEAKLISLPELPNRLGELNPEDSIVLYCHHGMRSMQAALWLQQKGFKNVKSLMGGIDAWAEEIDPSMGRY
ncbi:MAG: rhodanese [Omnitrophica bacterium RIFCSPHIGHO2_02_FULL_46_11]|nr:MAG: rhodanese [Omnitrophica bacterium RIFCSPLOWO2_01_FULL_45_10b]OGW86017.1 MAG: rhodanese [Omnitrophica bacterium RIFCSPHIGHO2_02_FULL_46_11]